MHFHPAAGLRLPARTQATSADVTQESVRHHAWLVGELVERGARLTDKQLDAQLPMRIDGIDGDSLRWLLSRLIGQPPQVVTCAGMVAHVLTFSAHHRLLALDRLRACGITDLGYGDPKHWFTGEAPAQRQ